jgi:hypothetical protein
MSDISRRSWRAAVAVTVGLVAAVLAGPSFADAAAFEKHAKAGAQEGIVQSVSAKSIVLKELDGRAVRIPVAVSTRVFVDGKRASLRDVRAGFVATAAWKMGKPARVLQAFDLLGPHAVSVGVVDSVSTDVLVVKESDGTTLSVPVNARTRVLIDGKRASLAAVKRGYTVVISANDSKGNKPAHELRFLRPV